jgi:hypothetical protein
VGPFGRAAAGRPTRAEILVFAEDGEARVDSAVLEPLVRR